jgi:hypothetical protein
VAAGEFQQSRLGQTVDDPADAAPVDRAGAHRARLGAGVCRARAQVSTVEPAARDPHQVRFRMPGDVVLGDDGVFRLGGDDAVSVDQERAKRVVPWHRERRARSMATRRQVTSAGVRSPVMTDSSVVSDVPSQLLGLGQAERCLVVLQASQQGAAAQWAPGRPAIAAHSCSFLAQRIVSPARAACSASTQAPGTRRPGGASRSLNRLTHSDLPRGPASSASAVSRAWPARGSSAEDTRLL